MIRNSLRQLWRTPVKTVLFFLLLAFSAMMVCIGGNLWYLCAVNMERFESIFTTIGTVEQKPERTAQYETWDAERGDYVYRTKKVCGEPVSPSVLDFEGAGYLSGPERRCFYAAYVPEYKIIDENAGWGHVMIVTASPLEDCIPAGPVKMKIKEILFSTYPVNTQYFNYCDHYNAQPEKLNANKTYVMDLWERPPHGWEMGSTDGYEYIPGEGISTRQAASDGTLLPNQLPGQPVVEIQEDFHATEDYKMWEALAREREMTYHTIPVTATENIHLMMPFYTGDAYVAEGSEFTEEDYSEGNKVCLISRRFARRNQLSVGDSLRLPLRYANYAESASLGWASGLLNAAGEAYPVFEESDYMIQGIYELAPGASKARGYRLEDNEVIVAAASIKNSDERNIADYGPMKGYTTSFQIPNGSIGRYLEAWEKLGIDSLEIYFYDKGYSQLEDGLKNMKKMAYILLIAGVMTAILILIFFCNMFITRQKKRTAVERSLGAGKMQCVLSLLMGIIFIAGLGSVAGSTAGHFLTGKVAEGMKNMVRYDTTYSNGALGMDADAKETEITIDTSRGSMAVTVLAASGVLLLTIGISLAGISKNLKNEPLILLSSKEE